MSLYFFFKVILNPWIHDWIFVKLKYLLRHLLFLFTENLRSLQPFRAHNFIVPCSQLLWDQASGQPPSICVELFNCPTFSLPFPLPCHCAQLLANSQNFCSQLLWEQRLLYMTHVGEAMQDLKERKKKSVLKEGLQNWSFSFTKVIVYWKRLFQRKEKEDHDWLTVVSVL